MHRPGAPGQPGPPSARASTPSGLSLPGSDGSFLDPLVLRLFSGQRQDALHEDAGQVHAVGLQLARLDQLLDLGDGDSTGHRAQRVEVACGVAEHEVAVAVAAPRADQSEVGDDRRFEYERLRALRRLEGPGLLWWTRCHDVAL